MEYRVVIIYMCHVHVKNPTWKEKLMRIPKLIYLTIGLSFVNICLKEQLLAKGLRRNQREALYDMSRPADFEFCVV